ncbi:unnamed protein product [Cochlearia groenlandica]
MDMNRNAHPDCVYADNPFHECASACLERISQGHVKKKNTKKQTSKILSFSGSFGRKKKQPLSKNRGGGDDTDDFFKHKPEKKQSQIDPHFPKNLVLSSYVIKSTIYILYCFSMFIPSYEKVDQSKVVSPIPRNQENNGKIQEGGETTLYSFLSSSRSHEKESIDDYNDYDDGYNNNEIGVELDLESVMSDTFVSVGKYRVRSGLSTILSGIIEKHGDIAQDCKLESDSMRSRYVECLCLLMQELRSTPVGHLTKLKVKEMLAVVKDLESVNIEVAWLRSILEEFARCQEDVEVEKEKQDGLVRAKREEVEAQEDELVKMEEEVAEARMRLEKARAVMVEMEKERARMENMGFKMEKFKGKSFIDELM